MKKENQLTTDRVLDFLKDEYKLDITKDDLDYMKKIYSNPISRKKFQKALIGLSSDDMKSYFLFFVSNKTIVNDSDKKVMAVFDYSEGQKNNYSYIKNIIEDAYDKKIAQEQKQLQEKEKAKEYLQEIIIELIASGDIKITDLIKLENSINKKENEWW